MKFQEIFYAVNFKTHYRFNEPCYKRKAKSIENPLSIKENKILFTENKFHCK